MRNALPSHPWTCECGVLNLDDENSKGTHWTCWYIQPGAVLYFDSYGLPPPQEFVKYIRKRNPSSPLKYNTFRLQKSGDGPICGHLCVEVLRKLALGRTTYLDILLKIFNR